ncbi:MAG: undecaprenyl-diphosphate phosphatase [Hyphomicrobiales bacterium]
MTLKHITLLAIIQGLTEFLPISSSAHLNLVHLLTTLPDEGVFIDVAIHIGSLCAVVVYFRHDVVELFMGGFDLARGKPSPRARRALFLAGASVPICVIGFIALKLGVVDTVRTLSVIAWANVIFAILLYWADRIGSLERRVGGMNWRDAILVGLSQIFAILPGASRSGVTITMARWLGYERTEAARFSMLLAIPTLLATGLGTALELGNGAMVDLGLDAMLSIILSFVAALLSISAMMALLRRASLLVFVFYRLALGAVLLYMLYFG